MTLLGEPDESIFFFSTLLIHSMIAVGYQVVEKQRPGGSSLSAVRMLDALCRRAPEIASARRVAERCMVMFDC